MNNSEKILHRLRGNVSLKVVEHQAEVTKMKCFNQPLANENLLTDKHIKSKPFSQKETNPYQAGRNMPPRK